jgi:hypothetical protein
LFLKLASAILLGALAAAVLSATALAEQRRKESAALRKQRERLEEVSKKLARRLTVPEPSETNKFLHTRATGLIERARDSFADEYRFDRLVRAADALLESSENIFESRKPERDKDDDDREETARNLERSYFRVQQAEYFAAIAKEKDVGEYVRLCRMLYQQARSAYDAQEYHKARQLADAAADLVSGLERLAQAAVRIADPPRLP